MATLTKKDKDELAAASATVARISQKAARPAPKKCRLAPAGWRCTRAAGHSGPCAARKIKPAKPATTKRK